MSTTTTETIAIDQLATVSGGADNGGGSNVFEDFFNFTNRVAEDAYTRVRNLINPPRPRPR
jgi:hypothetical protein